MFTKKHDGQNKIAKVKLKNGSEVVEGVLNATMLSLDDLLKEDQLAYYELVQKCKNPHHKMFGNTEKIVGRFGLIVAGSIHDTTRNIVISATQDDGLSLESPVEQGFAYKI